MANVEKKKIKGFDHIKALAFNRRASSVGELKALNYIEGQLHEESIKTRRHYFRWKSPISILIRLGYLLIIFNLIIFRQILILTIYFVIKNLFQKTRNLSLLPKEESKNLYSFIYSEKNNQEKPLVIFTAHYDSISVILPYRFQKIIFTFYKLLILFYIGVIAYFIFNSFLGYLTPFENIEYFMTLNITLSFFGVFISAPLILLVMLETDSYGSIDNASGVSVLIELAKNFKTNSLKNVDLLFIWTGAEEEVLKGSKKFLKSHLEKLKQDYDLNKSFNINVDMVGSYIGILDKRGILNRNINRDVNSIIKTSSNKLNIEIETFSKLFNVHSDHKSFKKYIQKSNKAFQIACVHSDRDSKYIHSSKDKPSRCSSGVINKCVYLLTDVVKSIDNDFESQ